MHGIRLFQNPGRHTPYISTIEPNSTHAPIRPFTTAPLQANFWEFFKRDMRDKRVALFFRTIGEIFRTKKLSPHGEHASCAQPAGKRRNPRRFPAHRHPCPRQNPNPRASFFAQPAPSLLSSLGWLGRPASPISRCLARISNLVAAVDIGTVLLPPPPSSAVRLV